MFWFDPLACRELGGRVPLNDVPWISYRCFILLLILPERSIVCSFTDMTWTSCATRRKLDQNFKAFHNLSILPFDYILLPPTRHLPLFPAQHSLAQAP